MKRAARDRLEIVTLGIAGCIAGGAVCVFLGWLLLTIVGAP